jgi:hypothetical protein
MDAFQEALSRIRFSQCTICTEGKLSQRDSHHHHHGREVKGFLFKRPSKDDTCESQEECMHKKSPDALFYGPKSASPHPSAG